MRTTTMSRQEFSSKVSWASFTSRFLKHLIYFTSVQSNHGVNLQSVHSDLERHSHNEIGNEPAARLKKERADYVPLDCVVRTLEVVQHVCSPVDISKSITSMIFNTGRGDSTLTAFAPETSKGISIRHRESQTLEMSATLRTTRRRRWKFNMCSMENFFEREETSGSYC